MMSPVNIDFTICPTQLLLFFKYKSFKQNALKSANSVQSQMKKRIDVVDTKRITGSLGLMVLRMAELIESGDYSQDELLKLANKEIKWDFKK